MPIAKTRTIPRRKPKTEVKIPKMIGVWIDHAAANIVELSDGAVSTRCIESNVERKYVATGGSKKPGGAFVKGFKSTEKNIDRARRTHLNRYYKEVAESLKGADRVVVMGPGAAKTEFLSTIEGKYKRLATAVEEVQTVARLTQRQLAAKVKEYFK